MSDWKSMKRSRSRWVETGDAVDELHERIKEAVDFVPPDEGEDDETMVEVSLADLRGLVTAAWDAEKVARRVKREARQYKSQLEEVEE